MDGQHESPRLLRYERLIPDSVGIAMRCTDATDFLSWVLEHLPAYAAFNSPLHDSPTLTRALAFAWTRAVWNGLPLNSMGVKPLPMHTPRHNDSCPCGSGKKFSSCCLPLPAVPTLTTDALWPHVLANMTAADRETILGGNRISRTVLIELAAHLLEQNRSEEAVAALEPRLTHPERYNDEDAAILLDLLCDAYGTSPKGTRGKLKILEMTVARAPSSALRAEAWQRLASIYMDGGDPRKAWDAFASAQKDNPQAETLGVLEVELLTAEHRPEEAHERAKFWLERLQRTGAQLDDPRIEFLSRMALGPDGRGLSVPLRAVSQGLRSWLERVKTRAVPRYTLRSGTSSQVLTPPPSLALIEKDWHEVFPLEKPFSTQDQLFSGVDVWDETSQLRWCSFLRDHDECFDSLDILDDLATAIGRHPHTGSREVESQLLTIVLDRNEAILERVCEHLGVGTLSWTQPENRAALRGLMRLLQTHTARHEQELVESLGTRMLKLNPTDDHGVRALLRQTGH
ncbi:MAG TPA: SEC-C domain-containing protein [Steroidobacteraceae bacterium]|jgi:hypothetical protein